ncbi:MAG: extracellular solute-binding protein [bacterium]|nr:extracellular solute-binding protein [bacterium]
MGNGRLRNIFIAVLALSVFVGQGCTKGVSPATQQASRPVTLNVWGVVDDVDAYQAVFQDYRILHPNVTIKYRRLRLEEYEAELVNSFAEDRGPDIFLIHNTWVGKYLPKITPMPPQTSVAVRRITGTIKKSEVYQLETNQSITLRQYKNDFADVAVADTIRSVNVSTDPDKPLKEDRIVALPLSVDTLGMFVNKDLLNASGIAVIPSSWTGLQETIPKLVKLDTLGQFVQYGTAMGTAYNIDRSTDIVTALMMQNGVQMSLDDGTPAFQQIPQELLDSRNEPPAYQAISFYTDFANPNKEVYTWNADQPDSLEAFIEGRLAFFFGYSYHVPTILARAPKMNLGIAALPQIEGNRVVNIANYWVWTVSKKSTNTDVAWNLLNFMIGQDEMQKYVDTVKRPASRKALLPAQYEDEDVGVFASQALTAQTWYRGNDPTAMEQALQSMIDSVQRGTEEIQTAVRTAQQKISQTIEY